MTSNGFQVFVLDQTKGTLVPQGKAHEDFGVAESTIQFERGPTTDVTYVVLPVYTSRLKAANENQPYVQPTYAPAEPATTAPVGTTTSTETATEAELPKGPNVTNNEKRPF